MNPNFTELLSVLDQEHKFYAELLEKATQLGEGVRNGHVDEVRDLTIDYDSAFGQISSLEERRLALCDLVSGSLRLPGRHPTLAQIASALPDNESKALLGARDSLKVKVAALSKANIANRILLEESLNAVAKGIELATMSQRKAATYGQRGTIAREPVRRNIVNQTA